MTRGDDAARLRWWGELALVAGFYVVYGRIRAFASGSRQEAFDNARDLIAIERWLGIYHEESWQDWALGAKWLVVALNYYYGSLHFAATAGVLIFLFRWRPDRYRFWRNVLAIGTALALIGFAFWPLMPPRLLPEPYGYVDTLARYPTIWDFETGGVEDAANPYAAMPSLHFGWSLWVAVATWRNVGRRWVRALVAAYPVLTLVSIVLTGNHFVLDAVGGAAVMALGWLGAVAWQRLRARREPADPGRGLARGRALPGPPP